jgi:hypothetical protein
VSRAIFSRFYLCRSNLSGTSPVHLWHDAMRNQDFSGNRLDKSCYGLSDKVQ